MNPIWLLHIFEKGLVQPPTRLTNQWFFVPKTCIISMARSLAPGSWFVLHSLKLTFSHLKIDLWKFGDSYWKPPFSGAKMLVFGRVFWVNPHNSWGILRRSPVKGVRWGNSWDQQDGFTGRNREFATEESKLGSLIWGNEGNQPINLVIVIYNLPAPPKRCQYDPKGWLMGTPYHSFSTP